jgi:hypothetical protein
MMKLYWHSLNFAHIHEYIYGHKMPAIIFAVTQQITMEYAGICQLLLSTNILSTELLLH